MAIPSYDRFIEPLLRYLARSERGVRSTDLYAALAEQKSARSVSDHLVLVGGDQLAELMIERGVGVTHEPIKVTEIDSDDFDGD